MRLLGVTAASVTRQETSAERPATAMRWPAVAGSFKR